MADNQLKNRLRKKIKGVVIERKDDFLTALEKNWRDAALKPLTTIFAHLGIRANHITYFGFLLMAAAIFLYFRQESFLWQLAILTVAGITDAIDGPTARNNNNVTIRGTWLDHLRDGVLVAWASYLIYSYQLLSLDILIIIWALQLLIIWVTVKDFLIHYLKDLPEETGAALIHQFSLDNLQASIIGRLQFFCWMVGYGLLLLFILTPSELLLNIGQSLITLEIIFAALNLLESYQKTSIEGR